MSKIKQFNSFLTSFKELNRNFNSCKKVLIEFYHYDMPSEPTVSVLNYMDEIIFDEIDGERSIEIRFSGGTDVCFREQLHNTNLSNGSVVFSSKHDDETYCLISFHEEVI
ncbi:hypothetical protein GCM10007971_32600 [Oceanobacillus indicireducens]|uniref:Uncharacterized protein n=1 Tax=Oceanobacillus indicireducens TaxID=1004261 RepID=A0A917Y293_9BACI|nr:hypothetical protein GCM10007971_32600 [Oceanobacillus indicireducens]